MNRLLLLAAIALSSGCASPPAGPTAREIASARMAAASERRAAADLNYVLTDHYPERGAWKASCETNRVTAARTCRAMASARMTDTTTGQPFGDSKIAIYISYLGHTGPIITVGDNLYPGESPIFRVDDNAPMIIGGEGVAPMPFLMQLKQGKVLRVQYSRWPTGAPQVLVDLSTAGPALQELEAMR